MPGAPGESLNGSLVVGLGPLGSLEGASIPDVDKVIVAAGSELCAIGAPFETANLGCVADELGNLVLRNADVMVIDEAGASAGREDSAVPREGSNAGVVARHGAELRTIFGIPNLNITSAETNGNVSAVLRPFDGCNIGVWASLAKLRDSTSLTIPDIYTALEANGNLIAGRPVQKVEVVIIHQTGGVKNAVWSCKDATAELCRAGWLQRPVVLAPKIDGL